MKLPKQIPIGSRMYALRYAKKGELAPGQAAECDWGNGLILIAKGQTQDDLLHTLIHEFKHAHQWESGLSQILDRQAIEMDAQGTASLITSIFNLRFKRGCK